MNPIIGNLRSGSGSKGSSNDRVTSLGTTPTKNAKGAGNAPFNTEVDPSTGEVQSLTKANRISNLLKTASHVAIKEGTLFKCSRCFTKCSIPGIGVEEWLKAPCKRSKPDWIHNSHEYRFCEPLQYCQKCCFYARAGGQASPALSSECRKPTVRGKANLAQFAKGKLPQSFKS